MSGNWFWKYEINNNVKHTTEFVFSVNGNQINGNYCSVFYEGSKIDCEESESTYCITLTLVETNVYEGTFQSFSHGGTGTIKIIYLYGSNELEFEILSSEGVFYLPKIAIFHR
ncbi:hypothetical protein V8G69_03445 [Gaetbulibacter sp. M235]|uniref:hypothetical protein n=1 Tax=Gaetbulibacter sp. M235 TaxID=3126510 RepID=UPI00374E971B